MSEFRRLKICFLAGTLGQGGAERQLYYMVKTLCEEGATVRILSLMRNEFWEEPLRALGVPIKWVGAEGSRQRRLKNIIDELRRDPPDIVQSQHFYTNLYAAIGARAIRRREIGAIRCNVTHEVLATGRLWGQLSLRVPRLLAANSINAIRTAHSYGIPKSRICLLPNVVDTERFRPGAQSFSSLVRILAVGRLVEAKNYLRFLSLLAEIRRRITVPFTATIVGSGPQRGMLERRAQELGLVPAVLAFKEANGEIEATYRAADIFVSTSDYEGTPNVIMEAMASALPIVATGVGGIPDLVVHGRTGYLFRPDHEAAMADAVTRLIQHREMRLAFGAEGREAIVQSSSFAGLVAHLSAVYRAALHPAEALQSC